MALIEARSTYRAVATTSPGWNHTVGSGNHRLLLILFGGGAAADWTMSAVTFNNVTGLHLDIIMSAAHQGVDVWYLLNPDSGAHAIAGTCSQALSGCMGAMSIEDVDPTTPLGTVAKQAIDSWDAQVIVPAVSGDLVVAAMSYANATVSHAYTEEYKLETDINNRGLGVSQAATGNTTLDFAMGGGVWKSTIGVAVKSFLTPLYASLGQFDRHMRIQGWF